MTDRTVYVVMRQIGEYSACRQRRVVQGTAMTAPVWMIAWLAAAIVGLPVGVVVWDRVGDWTVWRRRAPSGGYCASRAPMPLSAP